VIVSSPGHACTRWIYTIAEGNSAGIGAVAETLQQRQSRRINGLSSEELDERTVTIHTAGTRG
jgi:hypothetical protein